MGIAAAGPNLEHPTKNPLLGCVAKAACGADPGAVPDRAAFLFRFPKSWRAGLGIPKTKSAWRWSPAGCGAIRGDDQHPTAAAARGVAKDEAVAHPKQRAGLPLHRLVLHFWRSITPEQHTESRRSFRAMDDATIAGGSPKDVFRNLLRDTPMTQRPRNRDK